MSGAPDAIFERVAELTELYLRDEITDDQLAELEALVLDDVQAAQAMRTVLQQAGTMRVVFGEQRQFASRIGEVDNDEYLKLLQTLSPADEPEPVQDLGHLSSHKQESSKQALFAAGRYLLDRYLTPRVVTTLAAAAVLLLGVVLAAVLLPANDTAENVAEVPDFVAPTQPQAHRVVATITEQHGATWLTPNGEGALPDRTLLGPNQRLTLTKGFAEITTNRGARALVQAPATLETTASDNAVRLHRGKLVGICETPSSKGFVVHAPGIDVVDLGTRFGVEADAEAGSAVLVMEGSVRAEPTPESPLAFEPVVLKQNDARRVTPETGSLATIAVVEAPVFYEQAPHPYVTAVLDDGPVAYWRFEEEQGRTIMNEVDPSRDNLSMVGSAALTPAGIIGKAGRLENRAEPYGFFETANPIDQLSGFEQGTIEFWYYADVRLKKQEGYDAAMLLSLYNAAQVIDQPGAISREMIALELTDDAWLFDQERTKPIGWLEYSIRVYPDFFIENERRRDIYTDHAHPVQQWQHVVLVKQAETITLYLDGQPVEKMPHTFGPISPLSLRLGRTFDYRFERIEDRPNFKTPLRPFLGRLDEVALYDKPLTAEQVARHNALATGQEAP